MLETFPQADTSLELHVELYQNANALWKSLFDYLFASTLHRTIPV